MNKIQGSMLCCAIVALSGCQSFPMHFGMQDRAEASVPDMSSYFAQRLNDGRRHLSAQRPGAAVDAFRQASYHPDFAGEAYNGMAIAFDQMGRYDLAERFFAQAMEAAPEDERFARNAARFDTTMLARTRTEVPVQFANKSATPAATEITATLSAIAEELDAELDAELGAMPEERMQRVSTREVRIASREDWTSRAQVSAAARPAVMHIGSGRSLAERGPAAEEAQYPVRIALTAVPIARQSNTAETASSRFVGSNGDAVRVRVSGNLIARDRPIYPISLALDSPG
ncbi:tetratricopeptide repeat protein [Aurantiacibacter marinus]|uniref:Uncharacterized protein n=1 Tax=Aurantiacibacter marinus TaxID=874156 RepID=A0A0H0XVV6_9SPHN|nr:tetratricopeptide repeat protein [Aurantiacibacter marinus]KLI64405.1 hypothetical protein AAV99_01975 [Aurantiacibacter marinus]